MSSCEEWLRGFLATHAVPDYVRRWLREAYVAGYEDGCAVCERVYER